MRWVLGAAFAFVACGSRSDLTAPPSASPDAGTPASPSAVFCKPGDPMKELAFIGIDEPLASDLVTDGTWLYEDFGADFNSMSADGGPTSMLTQGTVVAPWNDGVYFVESAPNQLEWIRHDGTGKHVVSPLPGFMDIVAPPVVYAFGVPYNIDLSAYSMTDGSSQLLAKTDDIYAWLPDALTTLTDRFVHVLVEQSSVHVVDRRIDRTDGSAHDVDFGTSHGFGCNIAGGPNAACLGEVCVLDESEGAVTLPIPHACALLVDDAWAYYSLPSGFARVGLRTGTVEMLIPNVTAFAAAEANGCLYVEAFFTAPGAHIVRIPH